MPSIVAKKLKSILKVFYVGLLVVFYVGLLGLLGVFYVGLLGETRIKTS